MGRAAPTHKVDARRVHVVLGGDCVHHGRHVPDVVAIAPLFGVAARITTIPRRALEGWGEAA